MAYYATPTGNDTVGLYEFFNYVNLTAGGLFFPVIIFVIWIITFLATKQYSTSRAWTFASFLCGVLSIILATLNLIAPRFMYIFIILFAAGLVWLKLEAN